MLTKDLVRYRIKKDEIFPQFIDVTDAALRQTAAQLIALFADSLGRTREELQNESGLIVSASSAVGVVSRGLEKLLLDRTEFDTGPDDELTAWRRDVFTLSAELLSSSNDLTFADYKQVISNHFDHPAEHITHKLYRDLPPFQQVSRVRPMTTDELLHRYNCAQVQALLLHCEQLRVNLYDPQAKMLRQLFKYLRFQQLLAHIVRHSDKHYTIQIDGPMSLFYQTSKYGQKLSRFFPAVLHQLKWELIAEVKVKKGQVHVLKLDQTCGIQSHYRQFLSFVPEEITWFQDLFKKSISDWTIDPSNDLVALAGEHYCFPDFKLCHESGKLVYMELFHNWHAGQLGIRLQQLEKHADSQLILGISKRLLKDESVLQQTALSNYFSRFGFVFREMPTVSQVKPVLQLCLEQ